MRLCSSFTQPMHTFCSDLCTELNPLAANETCLDIVFADSNGVQGFLSLKILYVWFIVKSEI